MLSSNKKRTGLLLLAAWWVTSCGSQAVEPDVDVDELHTLTGRFVEEPVTEPLVAVEAYIGKDEFFLAYEGPDGLVFSGGNWSNRIDLNALGQGPDGDYAGPFILSLEYHQAERWNVRARRGGQVGVGRAAHRTGGAGG